MGDMPYVLRCLRYPTNVFADEICRAEQRVLGEAQEWRRLTVLEGPFELDEQAFQEGEMTCSPTVRFVG